jgi:hypothetical protein
MQPKDVARETAKVLQDYLTYQAVKLIIDQLTEMNPGEAIWLRQYSSGGKLQDGEAYIEGMMSELKGKELVMRILTVREDLAQQVLEFLPEMVNTGIKQANLEHRCRLLERLTQSAVETPQSESELKLDTDESSD